MKKLGVTGQAAASTADDTAQSAEATLESPSVVGLAVTESDDQLFALDIDGLGAALCYALTGRNDHLDGRVVALQKYRPDLPAGMLDVVRRTELRQADRFHTAEQLAQALRPYCESFRVEVDYPSLLTARNRARRQQAQADLELVQAEERPLTSVASPVAETSSGTMARPDASFAELQAIIPTPVNEQTPQTVSVEFAKLEQLLGGVIQKVDARREQDLGILSQLATLKRAQAEEQVRLIGELQVLRATVEQEQQATAQLKEELEQARRKAAADREYYEQQLGVLANDLQRAHANEQRLVAELATTNEQLAIAKTQAERLAVQLHQASEQADPRNPAQMFWLAYEQACRTDEPSTLADLYYDSLSEELP